MPARAVHCGTSATILAAAALALLGHVPAGAEVSQRDGVRVSVNGRMSPTALPRSGAAPVAVSFEGRIGATAASALPKLTKIEIAINRHGRLDRKAIPRCRLGHIEPSTTGEARAACGPSLIGEGSFSANVRIPEQSPFPSSGKLLAFNGRLRGRPAIFAHIFGTKPVPTSYVLPFTISRGAGAYGTVLSASLPRVTGEWGYVTGISLALSRRTGSHSYISASCPAPAGFSAAAFPLARTTFTFEGGLALTSTLNRSCKVR